MFAISTFLDRCHRGVIVFMAGTRAVSKLGHRVVGVAVFLMRTWLVIIGMAAGTIRRIGCARIRNGLCVPLVAIEAIERLRMCTWIIG